MYTQGQPVPLTFSCADEAGGSGIAATEAASARPPSGSNLPTGTAGMQVLTITATDAVGNVTVKTVNYRVLDAVNTPAPSAAPSARRSALTLGAPATFGTFTPGVDRDYTASTTANVISTAGDATLSVADPSSANTGKLMNGTFTLAQPLQAGHQRRRHRLGARAGRRLGQPDDAADLHGAEEQRRGHDRLQAVDRPPPRRCARARTARP